MKFLKPRQTGRTTRMLDSVMSEIISADPPKEVILVAASHDHAVLLMRRLLKCANSWVIAYKEYTALSARIKNTTVRVKTTNSDFRGLGNVLIVVDHYAAEKFTEEFLTRGSENTSSSSKTSGHKETATKYEELLARYEKVLARYEKAEEEKKSTEAWRSTFNSLVDDYETLVELVNRLVDDEYKIWRFNRILGYCCSFCGQGITNHDFSVGRFKHNQDCPFGLLKRPLPNAKAVGKAAYKSEPIMHSHDYAYVCRFCGKRIGSNAFDRGEYRHKVGCPFC